MREQLYRRLTKIDGQLGRWVCRMGERINYGAVWSEMSNPGNWSVEASMRRAPTTDADHFQTPAEESIAGGSRKWMTRL